MCTSITQKWSNMDVFQMIKFKSFRQQENIQNLDIPVDKLELEMYCENIKKQKFYKGIHAIYQICLRIPLLWFFVPFLYISILLGVGDRIYKYIAKKRKIIPIGQCKENICSITFNKKEHKK